MQSSLTSVSMPTKTSLLSVAFADAKDLHELKSTAEGALLVHRHCCEVQSCLRRSREVAPRRSPLVGAYFVWEDGFEAPAEVAEVVSIFMDLHPLAIVFDLCVHAVGTLLHGVLD